MIKITDAERHVIGKYKYVEQKIFCACGNWEGSVEDFSKHRKLAISERKRTLEGTNNGGMVEENVLVADSLDRKI